MRLPEQLMWWVAGAVAALGIACGTPGAPQPPSLQIPHAVDDLSGVRKGERVLLTWTPPTQTTDRQNIKRAGVTRVCRAFGEFPMAQCREVVKEFGPTELTSQTPASGKGEVAFEDALPAKVIAPALYATYAVEVLNERGKSAGLSNQIRVPLAPTLSPPADLKVSVSPDGPVLQWTGAQPPRAIPGESFSYRVYRRPENKPDYTLTDELLARSGEISVTDKSFEWEQTYDYKVTPVTAIAATPNVAAAEVEGDDTAVVRVSVHDTFPPARPTGLQAVYSGVGQQPFVDLTWAPNSENDLAGYKIFRHEEGQAPVVISKDLVKSPAFRDGGIQRGKTYYYSVVAVDVRGNESEVSETASETVPEERP